jgi:hypothetical protein
VHCCSPPQSTQCAAPRSCGEAPAEFVGLCLDAEGRRYTADVKAVRRVMLVLGVAGIIGGLARVRGKSSVPRSQGGWRELEGPDFR